MTPRDTPGPRRRSEPGQRRTLRERLPLVEVLSDIFAAAPVAGAVALGSDTALGAACVVECDRRAVAGSVVLWVLSALCLALGSAARNRTTIWIGVLAIAGDVGVATLPVHRAGATAFAAIGGLATLIVAEAAGALAEPVDAGERLGGPGRAQAVWAGGAVCAAGLGTAALFVFRPLVSGLGLAGLGLGAVAAVCLFVLIAALARAGTAPPQES